MHIINVKFELIKYSPYSVPSAVTVAYLSLEAWLVPLISEFHILISISLNLNSKLNVHLD